MAGRLNEFLERARLTPFVWGRFDCILFLADWSAEIGAGDPAQPFRGRYSSEFGATRIIAKAGGLAALVAREFEPVGWAKTAAAEPGDIGIAPAVGDVGATLTGALCLGDRWAMLTKTGLLVAPSAALCVWRHPCRPS